MKDLLRMAPVSRRSFMKGAAALAAVHGTSAALRAQRNPAKLLAFVGTYTDAVGNLGNGEGIYALDFDAATGELSHRTARGEDGEPFMDGDSSDEEISLRGE